MKSVKPRADSKVFFVGSSLCLAMLMFAGFARTFYLHALFGIPSPSAFLQIHALLMTGWVVLLLVQGMLVRLRRSRWHKKLGFVGAAYALMLIPIGCLATLGASQREVRAHSEDIPNQLNVLGLELTQMLLFAGLVGAGVWFRKRADVHKRLMLLATLCLLPNAIVRLVLLTHSPALTTTLSLLTLWALVVVGIISADALRIGRLHLAFSWGAFISVASLYVAWAGSRTGVWDHFWIRMLA